MVYGALVDLGTLGIILWLIRRAGISYRSLLGPPTAAWQVVSPLASFLSMLVVPLLAELAEPVVYLGIVLPRLEQRLGRPWIAATIVVLVWAAEHAFYPLLTSGGGPDLGFAAYGMVSVLPYLATWTALYYVFERRLLPIMAARWVFNGGTALALALRPGRMTCRQRGCRRWLMMIDGRGCHHHRPRPPDHAVGEIPRFGAAVEPLQCGLYINVLADEVRRSAPGVPGRQTRPLVALKRRYGSRRRASPQPKSDPSSGRPFAARAGVVAEIPQVRPLPSDEELVARLQSGDETVFASLVDAWSGGMLRLARSFGSTDESAAEVVQEGWLAVVAGIARYEGRSSPRIWVYRILVNIAKRRGARENRSVRWSSLSPADEDDGSTVEPGRFRSPGEPHAGHWREFPNPVAVAGTADPGRRVSVTGRRGARPATRPAGSRDHAARHRGPQLGRGVLDPRHLRWQSARAAASGPRVCPGPAGGLRRRRRGVTPGLDVDTEPA